MIACLLVAQGYAATDALSIFAMSRGQAVVWGGKKHPESDSFVFKSFFCVDSRKSNSLCEIL
jgi:hypothetical protein